MNQIVCSITDEHMKEQEDDGLFLLILYSPHVAHYGCCFGINEYGNGVNQLCLDLFYYLRQRPINEKVFLIYS